MMFGTRLSDYLVTSLIILATICVVSSAPAKAAGLAQLDIAYIEEVRSLETTEVGLRNPVGLAYSPTAEVFFAVSAHATTPASIITMTPYEDLIGSLDIDISMLDPINMVFDDRSNRLLLLDSMSSEVIAIRTGPDGYLDPSPEAVTHFPLGPVGLQDARGMAMDGTSGHLFILDSSAYQIVRIEPDPDGAFDGAAALAEGRVSHIDLQHVGLANSRGLALNPENGHLYFLSPDEQRVYELTLEGQVVATLDLSPFMLTDPQGLTFAPSGDLTDDPSIIHLYVADSGLVGGQSRGTRQPAAPGRSSSAEFRVSLPLMTSAGGIPDSPMQLPGRIIEFSLAPLVPTVTSTAQDVQAVLERTTETSLYSPPSPDPSGIAYLAHLGTLMISDGEVNEMPIYFTGDNLFEVTLSGSFIRSLTTIPFSNEPTGVAYNPANRHLFFSDDSAKRINVVDLGPDDVYGTADDTITYFRTSVFGSNDPEGVSFDTWRGHLFIADGVNAEIYEVAPGANGIFDGVSPYGDDQVSHFDTAGMDLTDPEGVEFDPDNGHLYVLSDRAQKIGEYTTDGVLIRFIDISPVSPRAVAGLAYAPSSTNASQMNLYIVDRGVDNDRDPYENDGKMYEISFSPSGPPVNQPPTVEAGSDQTIVLPNSAQLHGTASDDGLPGPLTTTWSLQDGPATVAFDDPSALDTVASFTTEGTYLLRLTADDGELTAYDELTIIVNPAGMHTTTFETQVSASSDDAEQRASGGVNLTSSDLELVFDSTNQTVGIRFQNVSIPQGATIVDAYIQFTVDETSSDATDLIIEGQNDDNAPTFIASNNDVSSRPRTTTAVPWSPVPWTNKGDAGPDQRTPNLASVIQEIVIRPGWASGNSLVTIITGSGERVAQAYDKNPGRAPLLHVEYLTDE